VADILEHPLNDLRDAAELALTVAAAVEAGVFEELAAGAATPAELAGRRGLDARAVRIVLPVLAELRYVELRDGAYALGPAARAAGLGRGAGSPVAGALRNWLATMKDWARLDEVLRGGPAVPSAGRAVDVAVFMAAMAAAPAERVERVVARCLARRPGARRALDLGGGPGLYAREFVRRGLEATLFDTPEVVAHVREAYGLRAVPGLTLAAGDFFTDPLPPGPFDVVLLSNITHIYAPAANRGLFARAGEVLAPGGVLAVADMLRGRSPRAARFAVVMLLRTEAGDTYTEDDYRSWLREAGFRDVEVDDIEPDRQLVTGLRA